MIKEQLITAALGAVFEKTGQLLQTTEDRAMQREMVNDATSVASDIIPSCPETDFEDSPKA